MQKNYFCADDNALMNILMRANDREDLGQKEILKVKGALQHFVHNPVQEAREKVKKARIQAVSSSTDFPINLTNSFNITVDSANFDLGYELAFQEVPKDSNKQFWEIVTGHNGIMFRRIPEGGRIRVEDISGDEVLAYVDYYGGALGFTDAMIRYRQIAAMYDRAKAFRDSFYVNKADNHYILIWTAGHAHVLAWQAGATQLVRDILTLNLGAAQIGDVNKDKGYSVTGMSPLILYASPFDEARIEAAYAVTNQSLVVGIVGAPAISGRPVKRIYTYNRFIQRNHPILCLPGQKAQRNEDLAPVTYDAPQDILTLNRMTSVWSIYGAAIADDEQFMEISLI
jgi:hypothetical protein